MKRENWQALGKIIPEHNAVEIKGRGKNELLDVKYFVKMVDTGSLTPVAEMADKFLVQAKDFPSIS
ncbi:hypothetical protein KCP74_15775 [Salmonella enterica subsp. enterica]|nr:hypothetical protein KCP74_15775 [Salmonella enterica subsp. enterica]